MIDEAALYELADGTHAASRPLGEITRRATVLRRRRRVVATGVTSAAACLALAVAVPLALGPNTATVVPAEGSDGRPGCAGPKSASAHDVAETLYAAPESVTGKANGVTFKTDDTCDAPTAAATWYTLRKGVTDRQFALTSPAGDGADQLFDPQTVDVDGAVGRLEYLARDRLGELYWTTADGTTWRASTMNMTPSQMVAAARSLALDGDRVDTSVTPAGLTELAPTLGTRPSGGTTVSERTMWTFGGEPDLYDWGMIFTTGGDVPFLATGASRRLVDINGRPGWIDAQDDGDVWLYWNVADGVLGDLSGKLTVAQALAIARSVVKVSPDDPRLR